jgi:hypothetical protein
MSLTEMHFKCGYWNLSVSFVSGLLVGILVGCQFPGWVGYETTSLLEILRDSLLLWYYGPIQALTDWALLFCSSTVVCRFAAWFFMGMGSSAPRSKCQPGPLRVPIFFHGDGVISPTFQMSTWSVRVPHFFHGDGVVSPTFQMSTWSVKGTYLFSWGWGRQPHIPNVNLER